MARNPSFPAEFIFLSFVGSDYSRSSTILNSEFLSSRKIYRQVRNRFIPMALDLFRMRWELSAKSIIIVMSPAHKITILAKLITRRNIYLDAGWPLTDGALSRGFKVRDTFRFLYLWVLDYVALHASSLTIVETQMQLNRIHNLFGLPRNRMKVNFTGLNELAFDQQLSETQQINELKVWLQSKSFKLIVMFRGRVNNEAGLSTIIESARELENEIGFIFLIGSKAIGQELPNNCRVVANVSFGEMKQLYDLADITLGQISTNPRLGYSIPHKAFEAGYFAKSFITTRTESMLELYSESEVHYLHSATAENLVMAIRSLESQDHRKKLESSINLRYQEVASQKVLGQNFEKLVLSHHFG